jgi:GTP cyclohydrolase IA
MTTLSNEEFEYKVAEFIDFIGDNPNREGLLDTPKRVRKAYETLFSGYGQRAEDVLKVTFSECSNYDQMIISDKIRFYSTCEHHILPFFGYAYVAYIPDRKYITPEGSDPLYGDYCTSVCGISKLSRLVEIHARRLQIQERMTQDIADDLNRLLQPKGVGVIIKAQHFCMMARGVEQHESKMITSAMLGNFREDSKVRHEFLELIK